MGIKFPTPWKTLIIKFPPPRDGKGVKCPGYARGGACWSFDLTGTLRGTRALEWIKLFSVLASVVSGASWSCIERSGADRLLNKYNKAWLNTNLAKTPTSFRNCVKYFENRNIQSDFSYNCKFIANFGFIYTPGFLYETGFLPGLVGLKVFHFTHYLCSECSFVLFLERKSLDFEGRSWNRGKCCDIQTYIHTYTCILGQRNVFRRALNSFNWRAFYTYSWLRAQVTQAGHVQKSRFNIFEVPTIPLLR